MPVNAQRLLVLAVVLCAAAARPAEPRFELPDQNEKVWSAKQVFSEGPVILISGAQRKTTAFTQAWAQALAGKRTPPVFSIANLGGLPFFIPKGSVRKDLREKLPAVPVLCDWDGKASKLLGLPDDDAVRVYGPNASMLLELREEPSAKGVERLLAAVPASPSADAGP